MNRLFFMIVAMMIASAMICGTASADTPKVGFSGDIGVPSGFALGVVVHPGIDALSLSVSVTENVLAPGGRASLKFDPLAWKPNLPFGVFLDLQGGFTGNGNLPGHKANLPSFSYDYLNAYLGLRFGKMNNFHWLLEAGPSMLHVATGNFQSVVGNSTSLQVGNPTGNAWLLPTFVTGFEVTFP